MKKFAIMIIIQILVMTSFVFPQGNMIMNGEKKQLRGGQILDIEEDGFGNIWIISGSIEVKMNGTMTDKGHLCVYTPKGEWLYFKDNKEVNKQKFTKLQCENNNIISCYTDNGMFTYDGATWKNLTKKSIDKEFEIPRKTFIYSITRDTMNRTWVETSKGLLLYEKDNFKRYLEEINFYDEWTYFSKGHVYSKEGIYQFVDEEFVKITETDYKNFRFAGNDKQNTSWYFRTFKEKKDLVFTVSCFSNNTFKEFDYELPCGWSIYDGIYIFPKFQFMQDSSIFITSGDFIGFMKNGVLSELPFEKLEIPFEYSFGNVAFDNKSIYFISYNTGKVERDSPYKNTHVFLLKYNGLDFELYLPKNEIFKSKQTIIRDIHFDLKGNLWLTSGNPQKIRFADNRSFIAKITSPEDLEIFDNSHDNNQSFYSIIFEDSQGRVWIGSSRDGIFMYQYN